MKKQEPRITHITLRDAKSTMYPEDYKIWRLKWDRFWAKLIAEARQQIEEDKKKGIKYKPTPKNQLVSRSFEMARGTIKRCGNS